MDWITFEKIKNMEERLEALEKVAHYHEKDNLESEDVSPTGEHQKLPDDRKKQKLPED